MTIATNAAAFLIWLVYASFFEWFAHRYIMHQRRFLLGFVYHGHAQVHHLTYRGDESFEAEGPVRLADVTLRWFSFPAILLLHYPFIALFQYVTGLDIVYGAMAGATVYYAAFEYTHYLMHVPLGHRIERIRWFRFLREHHRLHHMYKKKNFNVLFPLADLLLGTLMTSEQWSQRRVGSRAD